MTKISCSLKFMSEKNSPTYTPPSPTHADDAQTKRKKSVKKRPNNLTFQIAVYLLI